MVEIHNLKDNTCLPTTNVFEACVLAQAKSLKSPGIDFAVIVDGKIKTIYNDGMDRKSL